MNFSTEKVSTNILWISMNPHLRSDKALEKVNFYMPSARFFKVLSLRKYGSDSKTNYFLMTTLGYRFDSKTNYFSGVLGSCATHYHFVWSKYVEWKFNYFSKLIRHTFDRVNAPVTGHEPVSGHSFVFYYILLLGTIDYKRMAGNWFLAGCCCIYPIHNINTLDILYQLENCEYA